MEFLMELAAILEISTQPTKLLVLENILGLTSSKEGLKLIIESPSLATILGEVEMTLENSAITLKACLIVVNVTAETEGVDAIFSLPTSIKVKFFTTLLYHVCLKNSEVADVACMALCNLSRTPSHATEIFSVFEQSEFSFGQLMAILRQVDYNAQGCSLHYIGPLLSNLSQCPTIRRNILKDKDNLQVLAAFIGFENSGIRRSGVVGTIRNCCFNSEYHKILLGDEIDLLPKLLLPLAGGEEFDEEDNEKLPIDLQYLPVNKTREPDPKIRKMLLECMNQVDYEQIFNLNQCQRRENTFSFREYHKWETKKDVSLACENVVDLLIRTEDEIGESDLKMVQVPDEFAIKFEQMDRDFVNCD